MFSIHWQARQMNRWSTRRHLFALQGERPVRTQRWAKVTAANCQSTFALIVFICLLPYSSSLTAGVMVEHLRPGSFPGQSSLLLLLCFCFQVLRASLSMCVQGNAWESSLCLYTAKTCWKITKADPLAMIPDFKHKHTCPFPPFFKQISMFCNFSCIKKIFKK